MKISKKQIRSIAIELVLVLFIMSFIYLFFNSCTITTPIRHVRNSNYVLSVYSTSYGPGTSDSMTLTLIDLNSILKREKPILSIDPKRYATIGDISFIDSNTVKVIILFGAGGKRSTGYTINLTKPNFIRLDYSV